MARASSTSECVPDKFCLVCPSCGASSKIDKGTSIVSRVDVEQAYMKVDVNVSMTLKCKNCGNKEEM